MRLSSAAKRACVMLLRIVATTALLIYYVSASYLQFIETETSVLKQ